MRRLLKVILAVVTILFSALLIERSCHEDQGRPDPDRPGGVAMVAPPALSGAPHTAPMAHIAQATPRVESDGPVKTAATAKKRPEERGDDVAAAPAPTAIREAKADDDVDRTARTSAARPSRRALARTRTIRKEQRWGVAARKKATRTDSRAVHD